MGWNKDSSTGKARAMCARKQNKEFIPQSLWVGRCSALPMKTIKCERGLGWQTPSLKMFHSYFFFSQICISTMTSYGLEYPLGQPGSAVTLPNSLCTPRILLVGWGEEKRSWLCVSFAQQKWKHPCIINTISSTNPNHSPESAAVKKIDSIPAKSVQCCKYIFDVQKTRFDYFVVP